MRKTFIRTIGLGVILASALGAAEANVLDVIPQKALVVIATRNADAAERNLRTMTGLVTAKPSTDDQLEPFLLAAAQADRTIKGTLAAATVQRVAPMALVVVPPKPGDTDLSTALLLRVLDYERFKAALAKLTTPPTTWAALPGVTVFGAKGKSLYVARRGNYVVVTHAVHAVAFFDGARPLSRHRDVARVYGANDVICYVNPDEAVKALSPQIARLRSAASARVQAELKRLRAFVPPTNAGRLTSAEIAFWLRIAAQADSLTMGVSFSPAGMRSETVAQAVPGTMLSRVFSRLKLPNFRLFRALDDPGVVSAGWDLHPGAYAELTPLLKRFAMDAGLARDAAAARTFVRPYVEVTDALTGQGAFCWMLPEQDNGPVRMVGMLGLKPGSHIRATLNTYLERSVGFSALLQGPLRPEATLTKGVATHRGVPIDRLTLTFTPARGDRRMLRAIQRLYGRTFVVHAAVLKNTLIYSAGDVTPRTLKTYMDRVALGTPGGIEGKPRYAVAVSGLHGMRGAVMVFSAATALQSSLPALAPRRPRVAFDHPSAIGVTLGLPPGFVGIELKAHVPMQEMRNLYKLYAESRAGRTGTAGK